MKKFLIIFQKEFKDILRDRRTLMAMVVIPILLFPIMLKITSSISEHQIDKEKNKHLTIGIIGKQYSSDLMQLLSDKKDFQLNYYESEKQADTLIKTGTLDGSLSIDPSFDSAINNLQTGNLTIYYKSENWGVKDRLMEVIGNYKFGLLKQRLAKLNIQKESIDPININIEDVSSKEKNSVRPSVDLFHISLYSLHLWVVFILP